MTPPISVVIPVYNGAQTLSDCLRALTTQSLARADYEIIVVDDGSRDATAAIARGFAVQVCQQVNRGAPAARNTGWQAARGDWIAFTDADCIPSRAWLRLLLDAVRPIEGAPPALGAAGAVLGHQSTAPAARFVDLSAGLDTERHLQHPRFPFAPSGNVLYRRAALAAVGGFDPRYTAYDACDLHTRLCRDQPGAFHYVPHAVVVHRHRTTWSAYWRQQLSYGKGYGQFLWRWRAQAPWSLRHELHAWAEILRLGLAACRGGEDDHALVRRGRFVKTLAQRLGFVSVYWNPAERARW
jgi:glycosyltransferase involved in cell wall biosynthesis